MARSRGETAGIGTYGLRLTGLDGAVSLLQEVPAGWPRLDVVRREGVAGHSHDSLSEEHAVLVLQESGEILVDRRSSRAEYVVPRELGDEELVHPYLAPVAVVFGGWLGRESLHAGAFAVSGGVWAVVGDRESGKSSTLAALELAGYDIVCDDILVLDGDSAFAGPRSLDLRGDAAERLGVGVALGVVGARERWRVELAAIPNELSFRGFVFLEWGDGPALEPLAARERLERVAAARALRVAPDPNWLLRLAGRPAWVLRRPREWGSLNASLALLRDLG